MLEWQSPSNRVDTAKVQQENAQIVGGRQPGKQKANDVAFQRSSKKALFRSARGGRNLRFFIGQFAEDGGNLFKFGRLIEEEIRPGTQAFLAIL